MIIGTWIASGTVPNIIHAGLNPLTPAWFLAAGMLLCSLVSISLGTSWGTTGTVGLALMGIGAGFDIPPYWTAGAVESGAFFGDKVSPLSDTTTLALAVTGVGLFDHIRNMMPTTVPSMLIAFAIYLFAGFSLIGGEAVDFSKVQMIGETPLRQVRGDPNETPKEARPRLHKRTTRRSPEGRCVSFGV